VTVPVRDDTGRVVAALAVAEPVDAVFGSILKAARPGVSGETFAFEEDGRMLNAEDFGRVAQLRARIERLEEGGVILEPFDNRHGEPVVGAWRWLPEYGMGVAIQIDVAEAYAPLRYLNIAFSVVFGALVAAVIAALASLFSVMRLRSQLGRRRKLGPYELQRQIGEGGVATVYLARHDLLKRPTAVKLLKPARATDEMIARFEREVQLASSFSHPNTVEIFDYGRTRDGLFYYAMEYLDGLTVSQVLERINFFSVARSIHVLRQVCAGLSEAHGKGLVHRDVKPENIMVCRYGGEFDFVKILDFGLVKSMSQPHSRDLTRSQRILGTPLYMAPERLRDPTDVDARADIYAVGAVAYLMLSGKRLFDAAEDFALTSKILNEEPARLSAVAPQPVPRELELLVMACLEKDRANRPQGVAGLIEALDALAAEHRWTQREAQEWWTAIEAPPTSSARPS
jgi:serine/threonine-protein kinase